MIVVIVIVGVVVLAVVINVLVKQTSLKLSNRLKKEGRLIKRDQQFEDHTVFLSYADSHPDKLMDLLQTPGYLMSDAYTIDDASPTEFSIHCQGKVKWDARLLVEQAAAGRSQLTFIFTKWGEWSGLQWGSANECLTVVERTVLGIDSKAQIATVPTPLQNSILSGAVGMIATALHNFTASHQGELSYSNLAARYASAPAFKASA